MHSSFRRLLVLVHAVFLVTLGFSRPAVAEEVTFGFDLFTAGEDVLVTSPMPVRLDSPYYDARIDVTEFEIVLGGLTYGSNLFPGITDLIEQSFNDAILPAAGPPPLEWLNGLLVVPEGLGQADVRLGIDPGGFVFLEATNVQLGSYKISFVTLQVESFRIVGTMTVSLDLCAATVVASEVPRLGSPANPNALLPGLTGGPILGSLWDPVVDHTSFHPGALADFLAFSTGPPISLSTSFGTLIAAPPFLKPLPLKPAGVPFSIVLPVDCSFAGRALVVQGGSWAPDDIRLANALDVLIGTE